MDNDKTLNYIKATDLNRGKASSCIKNVHDTGCDAVILKNSEPYAVIISWERYNRLVSLEENEKRVDIYAKKLSSEERMVDEKNG